MSPGHEGQARQAGDGDVAGLLAGAEGAVGMLAVGKERQAGVDGFLRVAIDHVLRLPAVGQVLLRRAGKGPTQ